MVVDFVPWYADANSRREKSTMAKPRVNMTLAGDFRSLWRNQRLGLTTDFRGDAIDLSQSIPQIFLILFCKSSTPTAVPGWAKPRRERRAPKLTARARAVSCAELARSAGSRDAPALPPLEQGHLQERCQFSILP